VHVVLGAGDAPGRPGYISPSRLEEFTATLAPLGVAHQVHREPADPAQLALELAEREKARVLVVGLPPRRPTMKMILGSNVQHILAEAPCPVVCVKRDGEDATRVF
jgi:nucleotide-binding universal stress UspA family protein